MGRKSTAQRKAIQPRRQEDYRGRHAAGGALVTEQTAIAGIIRVRAQSSLELLYGRGVLTTRHLQAGNNLRGDFEISQGVRQPRDLDMPSAPGVSTMSWEDVVVSAGRRLRAARSACAGIGSVARLDPWAVVRMVALDDASMTDVAAGSTARAAQSRARLALRAGLDAVGDAYGMPSDFTVANVQVQGVPAAMEVTEDPDGTWRARSLLGIRWVASAASMASLDALARRALLAGVTAALGPGRHPLAAVAATLEAMRRQRVMEDGAAASERAAAKRREREIEQEKLRVLAR